jgi:hypothetical protein
MDNLPKIAVAYDLVKARHTSLVDAWSAFPDAGHTQLL